ncbi:hypothetical protein [Sphingobium terrigena]|nr:hypothetical protein [Sphingobium terrigena]
MATWSRPLQFTAILFGLLVALMGVLLLTAQFLRARVNYSHAVEGGRLSADDRVGYFSIDDSKIGLLHEVTFTMLSDPSGEEKPIYSILGNQVRRSNAGPILPDASPVSHVFTTDRRYADLLAGDYVSSIWTVAPLLMFEDKERLLATSFARFSHDNPEALLIHYPTEEELERENVDFSSGPSALLSYLWYVQKLVMPKLQRLSRSGQMFAAQRLARNTAAVLAAFSIENNALDQASRRRVNAVYLLELLFERPLDNLNALEAVTEELGSLTSMIDPEAELSEPG